MVIVIVIITSLISALHLATRLLPSSLPSNLSRVQQASAPPTGLLYLNKSGGFTIYMLIPNQWYECLMKGKLTWNPHSLACQPARITHAMCNEKQLEEAGVTRGMVRMSVGLEEVSVLMSLLMFMRSQWQRIILSLNVYTSGDNLFKSRCRAITIN